MSDEVLKIIFFVIACGVMWLFKLMTKTEYDDALPNEEERSEPSEPEEPKRAPYEYREIPHSEDLSSRRRTLQSESDNDEESVQEPTAQNTYRDYRTRRPFYTEESRADNQAENLACFKEMLGVPQVEVQPVQPKKNQKILVEEAAAQTFSLADMNLNSPTDLAKAFLASEILARPLALRGEFDNPNRF